jgi:hypothetical protein
MYTELTVNANGDLEVVLTDEGKAELSRFKGHWSIRSKGI